jgi:hypothetical protein
MERLRNRIPRQDPGTSAAVGRPEVAAADLVMPFAPLERSARRLQCVRLRRRRGIDFAEIPEASPAQFRAMRG